MCPCDNRKIAVVTGEIVGKNYIYNTSALPWHGAAYFPILMYPYLPE